MTQTLPPVLIESARAGASAVPSSTEVVVLAVLLGALIVKVLMQSAAQPSRRRVLRLLDIVIAPMLFVFVIFVLVRFHDLA